MDYEPRAGARPSLVLAASVVVGAAVLTSPVAALTGAGVVPEWLGSLMTLVTTIVTWSVVGQVSGNRDLLTALAVAPGALFLFTSAGLANRQDDAAAGVSYAVVGAVLAGLAVVVLAWVHRRFGTKPESEDGGGFFG